MITDKYTEQELREAWRIVLNSPTISQYWKDYDRWFNSKTVFPDWDWDLLADRELLSLIVMTLDEFQTREYKKGKTGACVTWGRELHNVLDLDSLKEKAKKYSDYVNYHSESEPHFVEKGIELGKLSEDEIIAFQTAGVIGKEKTSEDSFPVPYLLHKAELFLAYCDGMLWQMYKARNTPEMIAEIPIEQKEDNKKTCITRLLIEGLITKSEIVNPEDKKYKYYATEKFTPKNIRKCLCVNRIPWGHIASFKLIISESTKEPLTAEQLSDIAHNKARKKK